RPLDEGSGVSLGDAGWTTGPLGTVRAARLASIAVIWVPPSGRPARRSTGHPMPTHDQPASPTLRVVPRDQHPISRKDISPNALRVLYRLREGGHQAFLVGGAVRDLMVGGHPKDFDVATSATPEEV